jgi:hypothetical protein
MKTKSILIGLCAGLLTLANLAVAQTSVAERVTALKASLRASQVTLKHYEWIETTAISLKGDH